MMRKCGSVVYTRTAMPPISITRLRRSTSVVNSGKRCLEILLRLNKRRFNLRPSAQAVYDCNNMCSNFRMSKHGRGCTLRKASTPARLYQFSVPYDEGNFSQEVTAKHWGIGAGERVPLG